MRTNELKENGKVSMRELKQNTESSRNLMEVLKEHFKKHSPTVGVGGMLFAAGNLLGRLAGRNAAEKEDVSTELSEQTEVSCACGDAVEAAPEVTDNRKQNRFEIRVDGEIVGFTEYVRHDSMIAFHHTEIDGAFQGLGLGKTLIATALDAVRNEGLWVQAYCPFVHAYIDDHPEYGELVRHAKSRALDGAQDMKAAAGM